MTNETALFLQAQAAWAVARIVYHSLFSITLIFKCRLYTLKFHTPSPLKKYFYAIIYATKIEGVLR